MKLRTHLEAGGSYRALEYDILNRERLKETLGSFKGRQGIVDLGSQSGPCLSIGISGELAWVMFTASEEPPYLWALAKQEIVRNNVEFDACGTPSPIPPHRVVGFDDALEIAVFFFEHQSTNDGFAWEAD